MTHREIEENEIIERYVLHQLTPDQRLAFQEHYFSCDQCFEQAQIEARFVASVREASATGILRETQTTTASTSPLSMRWLKPALALAGVALVLLTITLGWMVFKQVPGLRQEIAREREARERIERESSEATNKAIEDLEDERRQLESERAKKQSQVDEVARNQPPQTNMPIVVLEAVRDSAGKTNELSLPANAVSALIWLDVEPGNRFSSFQLQIFDSSKRVVETIAGAKPNAYGALVVSVPATSLLNGKYVVKLYGVRGGQHELAGEYDLQVRRR